MAIEQLTIDKYPTRFLVFAMVVSLLPPLLQLWDFFILDRAIDSWDPTFHWSLIHKKFFATGQFWDDSCYNGMSLASNPTYGLFYFFNFFYHFLPFNVAYRLIYLIHYPLFTLGVILWASCLRLNVRNSLVIALLYLSSGLFLSMAYRGQHLLFPVIWMPFICSFTIRYYQNGKIWYALGSGAILGLAIVSGDIMALVYGVIAMMASLFWAAFENKPLFHKFEWKRMLLLPVLAAPAIWLCSGFVLLNSIDSMLLSDRSSGLNMAQVLSFSIHPLQLLETILPDAMAKIVYTYIGAPGYSSLDGAEIHWYTSVYFGPAALILIFAGIFGLGKRKSFYIYLIFPLALVLYSFGQWNPFIIPLIEKINLLKAVRFPAKWFLPSAVLLMPIILLGLDLSINKVRNVLQGQLAKIVVAIFILIILAPVLMQSLPFSYLPDDFESLPIVLKGLNTSENPNARVVFGAYEKSKTKKNSMMMVAGTRFWGINQYKCFDAIASSMENQVNLNFFWERGARELFGLTHMLFSGSLDTELESKMNSQNIRIIAREQDPTDIYLLADAFPIQRAQLLNYWNNISIQDEMKLRKVSPSLDPKMIFLDPRKYISRDGKIELAQDLLPRWTPQPEESCNSKLESLMDYSKADGIINVSSNCRALLIVNAAFTPGWHATIDDQPVWIGRVNHFLLGIPVENGVHQIKLKFIPPRISWGLPLSIFAQIFSIMAILALTRILAFRKSE